MSTPKIDDFSGRFLKTKVLGTLGSCYQDMRNLDLAGNLMMWSQSDADRNMHHMQSDLGAESAPRRCEKLETRITTVSSWWQDLPSSVHDP